MNQASRSVKEALRAGETQQRAHTACRSTSVSVVRVVIAGGGQQPECQPLHLACDNSERARDQIGAPPRVSRSGERGLCSNNAGPRSQPCRLCRTTGSYRRHRRTDRGRAQQRGGLRQDAQHGTYHPAERNDGGSGSRKTLEWKYRSLRGL